MLTFSFFLGNSSLICKLAYVRASIIEALDLTKSILSVEAELIISEPNFKLNEKLFLLCFKVKQSKKRVPERREERRRQERGQDERKGKGKGKGKEAGERAKNNQCHMMVGTKLERREYMEAMVVGANLMMPMVVGSIPLRS